MAVRYKYFLNKDHLFLIESVRHLTDRQTYRKKTLMFLFHLLADLKDESRKFLQIRGQIEIEI